MTSSQIILLVFAALIGFLYLKKFISTRGIVQYEPGDAAAKLKSSSNIIFLDVRTPKERKERSIKGSIHIPLYELGTRSDELLKYKNKEIICYCRSGNRSLTAAAKLRKKGFNSANLKGGIIKWNH
jgi:rhodanese-related sulfurtransferase